MGLWAFRVAVGVGVFCAVVLAFIIGLLVRYAVEKDQLQDERTKMLANYGNVTMEIHPLQAENKHLLEDFVNVTFRGLPVLDNNTNLTTQAHELLITNIQLQARISILEKRCPSGWRYFNTKCYLRSSSKKTWPESRQHCKGVGGDLVIINNKEEQVFIHRLGRTSWIGLRLDGDMWKWVDNTELSTNYWSDGQPIYPNEDCALIETKIGDPFTSWHDSPCGERYYSICEIPAYI